MNTPISKIKQMLQERKQPCSQPNLHWKPARLIRRVIRDRKTQTLLTFNTSLTAKLRSCCTNLQVVILSETIELPMISEAIRLGLDNNEEAWVRCVLLQCADQNWIYARTVIPKLEVQNPWYSLQTLGTKPLGEILFETPNIQRTDFEFAKSQHMTWPHFMQTLPAGHITTESFARRSVFIKDQHPLLLTEVFLPDLLSKVNHF